MRAPAGTRVTAGGDAVRAAVWVAAVLLSLAVWALVGWLISLGAM